MDLWFQIHIFSGVRPDYVILHYYIGGVIEIYYNIRWGGLPDLLQYYNGGGGGGVSRDPKFVLRNIWTVPKRSVPNNQTQILYFVFCICILAPWSRDSQIGCCHPKAAPHKQQLVVTNISWATGVFQTKYRSVLNSSRRAETVIIVYYLENWSPNLLSSHSWAGRGDRAGTESRNNPQ